MPNLDPLQLYDQASAAIAAGDDTPQQHKKAVQALARAGATELALLLYNQYGMASLDDEDALSLRGRLFKDKGLARGVAQGQKDLGTSADAYQHAYSLTKGTYSGINAATLFLLSGQPDRATKIAREILKNICPDPHEETALERYYTKATLAEALLLVGKTDAAKTALNQAIALNPLGHVAHASTLKQFSLILEAKQQDGTWLDAHRPPAIACFAGRIYGFENNHIISDQALEQISRALITHNVGTAYGALAAGSDIIIAEALLDHGGALHVVLPCSTEEFCQHSVIPFGDTWHERYLACLARAQSVDVVTNDASMMDRIAVQLAAEVAMGRAVAEADSLATRAIQFLLAPAPNSLSEGFEKVWRDANRGLETLTLADNLAWPAPPTQPSQLIENQAQRQLASMIFADFKGFGLLNDQQVATVVKDVFPRLSDALAKMEDDLLYLNSWGDGIFAVFNSTTTAARAAIALQKQLLGMSLQDFGLPTDLTLRIGGHYGPITFSSDPITGRRGVFGSQIAYAARIEPIAVPGSILVSDAFAARLAISPPCDVNSTYVGKRSLRDIPGDVRLFALTNHTDVAAKVPK